MEVRTSTRAGLASLICMALTLVLASCHSMYVSVLEIHPGVDAENPEARISAADEEKAVELFRSLAGEEGQDVDETLRNGRYSYSYNPRAASEAVLVNKPAGIEIKFSLYTMSGPTPEPFRALVERFRAVYAAEYGASRVSVVFLTAEQVNEMMRQGEGDW